MSHVSSKQCFITVPEHVGFQALIFICRDKGAYRKEELVFIPMRCKIIDDDGKVQRAVGSFSKIVMVCDKGILKGH